ncbi:transferrin-binding protein-like solute binding protein [Neisseria montereyensis]|uniref:Transferrin-binding protein B n=1 Tax=Neisseria montereyensis TaxID=2973938 RepID=A0ABT2FA43_9NEIS|nr:transferrin-binding protein-like solute binding protein [Neisseria montereyensis]MCS4533021.1 transferrin-binding protein-like solute binding protein [Neisseria montereyensis]
MFILKKNRIMIFISLFLTACATNKGDFGFDDIETPQLEAPGPEFKDEETPPRSEEEISAFMQPGLGVEIAIPRRNRHPRNIEESALLSEEQIVAIGGDLEIPHAEELRKIADDTYDYFFDSNNNFGESHKRGNLKYIRTGYAMVLSYRDNNFDEDNGPLKFITGPLGYVFYKGIQPSQAFPVTSKALYKGMWDFVTDAKQGRDSGDFTFDNNSGPGDYFGATSADDPINNDVAEGELHAGKPVKVGHSSEFEVDFANKTLTGSLYKNHRLRRDQEQEQTKRYSVKANLVGNRFRGEALAEDKTDLYFGKDADLEGGFFGPDAEELAGKFLARDSSLFGVFGAQREKQDQEETETILDAFVMKAGDLTLSKADNFGDARQLVVNGQVFSLLPTEAMPSEDKPFMESLKYDLADGRTLSILACCSNLDYLKFGSYQIGTDRDSVMFFLQGDRTPLAQVPTEGNVRYQGTWQGRIISKAGFVWSESPNNEEGGSRAVFDVDFAKKEINGTLTAENRVSPTFTINGQINGNGFSGVAKTDPSGFIFDPQSSANQVRANISNADVRGGFYGPSASELGGIIHSNNAGEDGVVGSFGAKKQVPNR